MTTGRINQVTVLRARIQGPARGSGYKGFRPSPEPELVTDRFKSRPPAAIGAGHLALADDPSRTATYRVPSPPISHASETLPPVLRTGVGPFGEDYRRTAAPRCCQDEADLQVAGCRLKLAIGYQIHIPPHRSQQRQRRSAKLSLPGSQQDFCKPTLEPGHNPIPSGYILQGRRINRSDPRRPAVPKHHPRASEAHARAESTPVSQRSRHPFDPLTPVGRPSSRPRPLRRRQPSSLAPRVKVQPVSRLRAESKAEPSHRHSHLATITPQPWSPDRHP